jgi:DNA-binding NarL/FixJ family response regulator
MIKLILADDHAVTRKGIKTIIEQDSEINVIKEVSNGKKLLDYLLESKSLPDIIMLDLEMPVMDGPKIINLLHEKFPNIKIIIFSLLHEPDIVINMISKGASGFISKSEDISHLAEAIKDVYTTGHYFGELVKKEYFNVHVKNKDKDGFTGRQILSSREVEFIKIAASNLTYPEIALQMNLSIKTIENYRDSLFQKLEINNRPALILFGVRNGIIPISNN